MRLRNTIGTLVLALTLGAALPAAHAQYPPTVGSGRVTRSELKQCQCTQFSGDGFAPGTTVVVVDRGPDGVERTLGTATADERGRFRFKACLGENAAEGTHTLIGRGVNESGGPREVSATVRVAGSVCFRKGDEMHDVDDEEQPRDGGTGGGDGGTGGAGGGGLPRTGAGYVLPGLLLGFALVVGGTVVVHLTRRRRLVTG